MPSPFVLRPSSLRHSCPSRRAIFAFLACAVALASTARAAAPALTLEEAIHLALEKNQQIKVESYGRSIARANLLTALGQFDPAVTFRRSYSEDGTPYSADPFIKQLVQNDSYSLALEGRSPWGMTYSLGAQAQNQRSTVNTTVFPQGFLSFAGLSVTQPLLRGFGFNAAYADVRIAKADRSISDWQFRQTAIDTVTHVVVAYSDLAFAQQQLRIAERSRNLAAGLLDENEKRYKVGSISESEVTQARARTANRAEAILYAEQGVADATNRLRQLIGEIDFPIDPETFALELIDPPDITVQPAQDLQTALELRPDYQAAKLGLVKNVTREKSARNRLLPEVDFVGSYGYAGLDTTFPGSRRMVADRENRSYSAGLVVSVPLTFAEGRGRLRSARLQARQAEADLLRLKQDIALSIAHAAGEIRTTRRRVVANHAAYDLAKQALDAELKKLRAGTSNSFFVLNLQEQLAGVESSLYNSLADQRRALAFYDQEIGRTLLVHHLTLDPE